METIRHRGDESTVMSAYTLHRIVPDCLSSTINSGGNRPFDPTDVPYIPGAPLLSVPKPDNYLA